MVNQILFHVSLPQYVKMQMVTFWIGRKEFFAKRKFVSITLTYLAIFYIGNQFSLNNFHRTDVNDITDETELMNETE